MELVLQRADDAAIPVPAHEEFVQWINAVTNEFEIPHRDVCIRIVNDAEMRDLNGRYRNKSTSTNVLSFRADFDPEIQQFSLGDIILCADVVENESRRDRKALQDHWAHLTIHGTLHLLGFDHETDQDAFEMESLEREILAGLSIADPYR
ncbi:MAG: rRNA maturation RNase YbeY [Pseudomonadota bacterium]